MFHYMMYFLGRLKLLYFNQVPRTRDEYKRSRQLFTVDSVTASIIANLAAGTFLAGYLKYLGISDAVNGIISSVPIIASVMQPIAALYVEKLKKRKLYVCVTAIVHRLFLVLMFFLPLFIKDMTMRIAILVVCFSASSMFSAFLSPAASNWVISLTPPRVRGRYFSLREKYNILLVSIAILCMGRLLDVFKDNSQIEAGYYVLSGILLVLTLINFTALSRIMEPDSPPSPTDITFLQMISMPFKVRAFLPVMIVTVLWNISIYMVIPYASIFYISDLKLSYTFLTFISFAAGIEKFFLLRAWGRLADRKGWAHVNKLAIGLLGFVHLFFLFLTAQNCLWFYPLLAAVNSVAWAVLGISLFNIQFDYAPEVGRTLYIGANAAISGAVGFLGTLIGAFIMYKIGPQGFVLFGMVIKAQQVLFVISGLLSIACAIYIHYIIEKKYKTGQAGK